MMQKKQINTKVKAGIFLISILLLTAYSIPYTYAATDKTEENPTIADTPGSKVNEKLRQGAKSNPEFNQGVSEYLPKVWCADIDDEPTKAICWKAYQASLNYYEIGLQQRTKTFRWQHISTQVIFFVVLALVALGIYFAWIQFKHDMGANEKIINKGEVKEHSLELSTSGIKVSSPVLGVIILALSLAFFYLYLVYVYPIVENF